ncbi:MAG: UPF0280 family protein [Halanaerobiaceae bacterium]
MYEPRFYRKEGSKKLKRFHVCYRETDLLIFAPEVFSDICFSAIRNLRLKLDSFIKDYPIFAETLVPIRVDDMVDDYIKEMVDKSEVVGVGPMASVAGLFAETVGKEMLKRTDEVIVENGGDLFAMLKEDCKIGIYAGDNSPFKDKLALEIKKENMPLGICSSSGMMGPSLSKGKADLVTILSKSTLLADAAATAVANRVSKKNDVNSALNWGRKIEGVTGILIIKDDNIGIWGDFRLVKR